ncbi:cytochrome b/b6 domain-containing protein [Geothrix alkalitolerans]|uniref:cytochrome b/b6 domain-containing protein n=1 Tax=Geothrix alkalitolerans TaxID=2922724 RepID=UPI001FAF3370|nr:cytochrome b/b6 domain-containing protein [Geothrix alkalitolerans]
MTWTSTDTQAPAAARRRGGSLLLAFLAGLFLASAPLQAAPAKAAAKESCFDCHSDKDLTKEGPNGTTVPLFVDAARFGGSVHASFSCKTCHAELHKDHPGDGNPVPKVKCGTCHTEEAKVYQGSIHGMSQAMGASAAASCVDCHGNHYIVPVKQTDSPVYKMNLSTTCAKCHANKNLTDEYKMKYPAVASQYQESIHGKALLVKGLIVAPSCNDCHGVHDIKRSVDRSSPINHANVAKTCGRCHVKVEEVYNQSVHGQLLIKGDPRGPVCIQCHSAHQIETPVSGHFKAGSDMVCGKCHADRLEHYRDTYHGKAMALGKANTASAVAACYDCHGHHDVLRAADPNSRLSPANIVNTCKQCHANASVSFAKYAPHANPMDRKNYPVLHYVFLVMTTLLVCTFSLFGAHTILWLFRSIWLYRHDSKQFREAKIKIQEDDEQFTRFQPFERFLHILVVTSFLLLTVTGMPLKFYYTNWAKAIFRFFGGADVARTLHHFGAVITFVYFALHVSTTLAHLWQRRGFLKDPETGSIRLSRIFTAMALPDSMIPTKQDLKDFVAHNRWFFGKGPRPEFDRWTYFEKFDYLAVFWGVFAIGVSGLIMWFPEFFSKFMPGWMINVSLIVHSDEALLAAGFIFTVHFFNTHFRLEKFPMDTVIFSGRISKSEMLHERKRWYDRLVAEGRLDSFRVKDEWEAWKGIARSAGYIFFGVGLVLLFLIIYAMTSRLAH